MTKMDWFNIITGIAGICGALSWIPIVLDKIKQREVKASLIHCRFFDRFSYPILPPDYVGQQLNSKDVTFDKYEGALIVVGIYICSTNKDFVVDKVKAVLSMDKSEIEAILVSLMLYFHIYQIKIMQLLQDFIFPPVWIYLR